MPIFEFSCPKCDNVFDKLCRDRNTKEATCSKCGFNHASKQLANTAKPTFNGTGFYETDYKNH